MALCIQHVSRIRREGRAVESEVAKFVVMHQWRFLLAVLISDRFRLILVYSIQLVVAIMLLFWTI